MAREQARRERPPPDNVFVIPTEADGWYIVRDACRKDNMVFLVDITDGSSGNCRRVDSAFFDLAREFDGIPFFLCKVGPFGTHDQLLQDLGGVQYTPTILIGFYGETLKRVKYKGEGEIRNGLASGRLKRQIEEFRSMRGKLLLVEHVAASEGLAEKIKKEMSERERKIREEYELKMKRELAEKEEKVRREVEEKKRQEEEEEKKKAEKRKRNAEYRRETRPQHLEELLRMDLDTASIRDIKAIMIKMGISPHDCLERSDMKRKLRENVPELRMTMEKSESFQSMSSQSSVSSNMSGLGLNNLDSPLTQTMELNSKLSKEKDVNEQLRKEKASLENKVDNLRAGLSFFDLILADTLAQGLAREQADRERPPPDNVFVIPSKADAWYGVEDACRKENMVFLVDITDGSSENCRRVDRTFFDLAREFDGLPFFLCKVGPFGTHDQLRQDLGGVQYTPTILIGFYGETLKRVKYEGEGEIRNGLATGRLKRQIEGFRSMRGKLLLVDHVAEGLAEKVNKEMSERERKIREEYELKMKRELAEKEEKAHKEVEEKKRHEEEEKSRESFQSMSSTSHGSIGSITSDSNEQKYVRILDKMMSDTRSTILLHYHKMYLIGSSGIGKSTARRRLTGLITNLASLPEEEQKHCSTNLAECTQMLALMSESDSKVTFKVSGDLDEETQMLFAYLHYMHKSTPIDANTPVPVSQNDQPHEHPVQDQSDLDLTINAMHKPDAKKTEPTPRPVVAIRKNEQIKSSVDVEEVIIRLRDTVGVGNYTEQLSGKFLLNLIDVGGQPGFLEMLPFLSKGPGMFLAFFRLDKDLDEPCEVLFERGEDKITPYKSIYTIRETLSQILSAISHHIMLDLSRNQDQSKLRDLALAKPVVTLVGTFKDKLETKVKSRALQVKLSDKYPSASESDKEEVIKYALTRTGLEPNGNCPTDKVSTDMRSTVNQLLASESFKKEIGDHLDVELKEKDEAISSVTRCFEDLLFPPTDRYQFVALDNFTGTEADISPLRDHLQDMIGNFFSDAKLRIRPPQLLLGVVLRKEYDIVSMDDCIRIGNALSMGEEEVKFTIWYLDRWVGALIYHPEIKDTDDWFNNNVICSPQVIFDSVSSLIIESLLEIHSPKGKSKRIRFKPSERKNWTEKGQFSLDTVKRCYSDENKEKVKHGKLIPVEKLVKLLEYSNLLSVITTKKKVGIKEAEEVMCFIPAILECASRDELEMSFFSDTNFPSPIKITFASEYVPIGVFCAMISQLVSRGSEGILGMRWELVESGVKRNIVSFRVGSSKHDVTLVAHVNCYELRVKPRRRDSDIHSLCSYILSSVLYVMKEICKLIEPIIAFDCQCDHHQAMEAKHSMGLCHLLGEDENSVFFECKHSEVNLTKSQEYWFVQRVSLGKDVCLKALPHVSAREEDSFSFKWSQHPGSSNELHLKEVMADHCTGGYYTCKIGKNGEHLFSVHHCLKAIVTDGHLVLQSATPMESNIVHPGPLKTSSFKKIRSVLTIDDLKRETELTDNQLDANVEIADLPELAAYFDNTDDYIEKLGLSSGQRTDVRKTQESAHMHGTRTGMKLALKYWMEKNPYEASYRALLLMLVSLEKGDIAVNVCKYLSKKVKPSPTPPRSS